MKIYIYEYSLEVTHLCNNYKMRNTSYVLMEKNERNVIFFIEQQDLI